MINLPLSQVVFDIAESVNRIDQSRECFKEFRPGVGPYGEPQLVRGIINILKENESYSGIASKRTPDILIPNEWAIEVKIVRPFGDNGKEAENWSVNMLHPYKGNVSSIGDALKLLKLEGVENKAILVIGYEHTPPEIDLEPLIKSFELLARNVLGIKLSERIQETRKNLIHPIHQQLHVYGWEVQPG